MAAILEQSAGLGGAEAARDAEGARRTPHTHLAMAATLGTGARAEETGQEKQVGNPGSGPAGSHWLGCTSLFTVLCVGWLVLLSI